MLEAEVWHRHRETDDAEGNGEMQAILWVANASLTPKPN